MRRFDGRYLPSDKRSVLPLASGARRIAWPLTTAWSPCPGWLALLAAAPGGNTLPDASVTTSDQAESRAFRPGVSTPYPHGIAPMAPLPYASQWWRGCY